jgi:hypothetical protein
LLRLGVSEGPAAFAELVPPDPSSAHVPPTVENSKRLPDMLPTVVLITSDIELLVVEVTTP